MLLQQVWHPFLRHLQQMQMQTPSERMNAVKNPLYHFPPLVTFILNGLYF